MRYVEFPGKYEGEPIWVELLHQLALEGASDDELGSVSENGFISNLFTFDESTLAKLREMGLTQEEVDELRRYAGAIITENDLGFVTGEAFVTAEELASAWDSLMDEIEELAGVE